MHTVRALAAALVAVAAFLILVPSASATGATTETFRQTYTHVDDHGDEAYILDVEVVVHMTTRPDGTLSYTNNTRQVQTHTVHGTVVDTITSNYAEHGLYAGEDVVVSHTGGHDRYDAGEDACHTTTVWQVVDNELVVHQFKSVCH